MMSESNCPYCKNPMLVIWDSEDGEGEWHCTKCNKHFYIKPTDCNVCKEYKP